MRSFLSKDWKKGRKGLNMPERVIQAQELEVRRPWGSSMLTVPRDQHGGRCAERGMRRGSRRDAGKEEGNSLAVCDVSGLEVCVSLSETRGTEQESAMR